MLSPSIPPPPHQPRNSIPHPLLPRPHLPLHLHAPRNPNNRHRTPHLRAIPQPTLPHATLIPIFRGRPQCTLPRRPSSRPHRACSCAAPNSKALTTSW
ncbi:hypothetical protein BDD12DRAFT_870927 [Trichophaea hybrida]|nr:hypothetical protein BDD12DRAFT_870927 [Trichophaea hybrida]